MKSRLAKSNSQIVQSRILKDKQGGKSHAPLVRIRWILNHCSAAGCARDLRAAIGFAALRKRRFAARRGSGYRSENATSPNRFRLKQPRAGDTQANRSTATIARFCPNFSAHKSMKMRILIAHFSEHSTRTRQ
ncbi:hypothetical protein HDG34_006125 [Paraburkholderia sp. HC6.4b]|uniref:hypothetical protein n=1 Tax=unclassified Paraburkholderia TaxID=2615204 RepID=UPI00161CD737|nr:MULTISPECIES: hypothetical protein [unclassified Paraburkholderia]MBB5412154.1 hypothetical protein [Paraburkholderia sp. HC6.4b]MBB5454221.1 hypothetical protein [Paraburkholderia sp. Kb1A]